MQLARTLLVTLTILATSALGAETNMKTDTAALASDNPLARESTLPFQLPPFDKITDAHIGPALDAGMAQQRKEIDAIASSTSPPTFENTITAIERSGDLLNRASGGIRQPHELEHESHAGKTADRHGAEAVGALRCDLPRRYVVRAREGFA